MGVRTGFEWERVCVQMFYAFVVGAAGLAYADPENGMRPPSRVD